VYGKAIINFTSSCIQLSLKDFAKDLNVAYRGSHFGSAEGSDHTDAVKSISIHLFIITFLIYEDRDRIPIRNSTISAMTCSNFKDLPLHRCDCGFDVAGIMGVLNCIRMEV
jgi:hypothetical protein